MSKRFKLEYKNQRYEDGLCVNCALPRDGDEILCANCKTKHKEYMKLRRQRRKVVGCCIECGASAEVQGKTSLCLDCWFKRMALSVTGSRSDSPMLRAIFEKQKGRCAYTNEVLVPGVTACVDHRFPRALGGINTPDNLQWVTKDINRLKGKRSHDDFVALCLYIANKYGLQAVGSQSLEAQPV